MNWKEVKPEDIFRNDTRHPKPITGGVIVSPERGDLMRLHALIKKLERRVAKLEKRRYISPLDGED